MVREYDIRIAIHNHGPEDRNFPAAVGARGGERPRPALRAMPGRRAAIAPSACPTCGKRKRRRASETVYPDDPVKVIALAGPRLLDMHIKDLTDLTNKDSQCDVGDGEMPIPAIFRELKKINYQGCVNLEYEINADNPLPGVERSFSYMRGVLAGLAAA